MALGIPAPLAQADAPIPRLHPAQATEGDRTLQECIAERRSLAALFLVDESLSLKNFDPGAARVPALQSALSALDLLRRSDADRPLEVFVEFLSFETTARRSFPALAPWQTLPTDIEPISRRMQEFATRHEGEDTDYVGALEPWFDRNDPRRPAKQIGAIEMLEMAPPQACQVLVWFTDGKLEYDFRGRQKSFHWDSEEIVLTTWAEQDRIANRAEEVLCEPGGVVDRLREGAAGTGITPYVAVVALDNPIRSQDFSLIEAIAVGRSSAFGECGAREASGSFLKADEVGDLIVGLRRAVLGAPDAGDASITTCLTDQIRPGQVLNCEFPFFVAESLTSFNLLTTSTRNGVDVSLVAPDGSLTRLVERGVVTNGVGARLEMSRPLPEIGLVDATMPQRSSGWAGEWRVRYSTDNPQLAREVRNRAEIYVVGRVEATLRPGAALVRGREGRFRVELRSSDGAPLGPSAFGEDSSLSVTVAGALLQPSSISPDGSFEFLITPPDDPNVSSLPVVVDVFPRVRITETAVVDLTPWRGELQPLILKDPARYPIVELLGDFTPLDIESTESRAIIRVDATAEESGGCVQIDRVRMVYPPALLEVLGGSTGAPTFKIRSGGTEVAVGASCAIRVEDGQILDLDIVLRLPSEALRIERGQVRGDLVFTSTSAREPSERDTFTLEAVVAVEPKISTTVNRGTAIWLMGLAILLPIILMYLVSVLYSARLRLPMSSMRVSIPVILRNGRVLRGPAGRETTLRLSDDDMALSGLSGDWARSVDISGFRFSIRPSVSPVGDPVASVTSTAGEFVISRLGSRRRKGNPGSTLTNVWALAVPDAEIAGAGFDIEGSVRAEGDMGPVSAQLLALVPSGLSAASVFSDIVGDVERKAFAVLEPVVFAQASAIEKARLAEDADGSVAPSDAASADASDLPASRTAPGPGDLPQDLPGGGNGMFDSLPGDENRVLSDAASGSVDLGASRKLFSPFRRRRSQATKSPSSPTVVDYFDDDLPT